MMVLIPISTFADVVITEIMYDAEGSDAGKEWVEIYNNSGDAINLNDYHFYEAGIHHGLVSEDPIYVDPNEYAVIVQDVDLFKSEYGSNISLVKSSFSLSNTGEELAFSNKEKEIVFSLSYSSEFGASGNTYTLNYGDGGWFESSASPGYDAGDSISIDSNSTSSKSNNKKPSSLLSERKTNSEKDEFYTAHIEVSEPLLKKSTVSIDAYVTHTKGVKTTNKLGGVYYLNLGDGNALDTKRRIEHNHIYKEAGTYHLVLEYYSSELAKLSGDKPKAYLHKTIIVYENSLEIAGISNIGSISIINNSPALVDLHQWNLKANDRIFSFPQYSFINQGEVLMVSADTHKLGPINHNDWVLLRNEHNNTVSSFTLNKAKLNNSRLFFTHSRKDQEKSTLINEPIVTTDISSSGEDHLGQYLREHPNKELVSFENNSSLPQNQNSSSVPTKFLMLSGILAVVLVVIRIVLGLKQKEEIIDIPGEIELIE